MKYVKKRYIILAVFTSVIIFGFLILSITNRPLSKNEMTIMINKDLTKLVAENDEITSALLTIYSDKLDLNEKYAVGKTCKDFTDTVTANHPYYSASIGKTFTAALIGMLSEEGVIHFNDLISGYTTFSSSLDKHTIPRGQRLFGSVFG
jgi:CubicO group peptidase (beta-lactamase class C family)